jgi:transcriptional regulator with GAF, ATPase, and Fis domain
MKSRFSILPDPRFEPFASALDERICAAGDAVDWHNFPDLLDDSMRTVLAMTFHDAGAHEGTVWLVDFAEKVLVPAYNTGPRAAEFVGNFRQPLARGLIASVFDRQDPVCENDIQRNAQQDQTLDTQLQMLTCSMIAVPFYFARRMRGVISCVQLKARAADPDPPGFPGDAERLVLKGAQILAQLIEYRLIADTISYERV